MNRNHAVVCPQCGASLARGATSCQYCGTQISGSESGGPVQMKYCKFCGERIPMDAVVCTKCGRQVEKLEYSSAAQPVVINNVNSNVNSAPLAANRSFVPTKKPLNKWVAFFLCFFFGIIGAHKFYEGKTGMGILYLFTGGLLGVGTLVDLIVLLFKPNPYYI